MPLYLAKVDGPWPLIIFAVVVAFQVGAALWHRLRNSGTSNDPESSGNFPRERPWWNPAPGFPEQPSPPFAGSRNLSEAEQLAKLERQLRGTGNWRGSPPPPLPPPITHEYSHDAESSPSPENWVTFEDTTAAMQEAHRRFAVADAVVTESPPLLRGAQAVLWEATARLAAADAAVANRMASRGAVSTARHHNVGVAAEMARSFREPATARGAVIAAILLGRPKALEDGSAVRTGGW